ncbi:N-acylneuraminate-9-phosphatase isoform X1 [Scleropages formosus]|uniref:N-acetylneuraminic acid phosphatase n=1 Tax=Scleropages formosus TaxID=113540 RepID=A0A8C9R7R7_SCLFO|nr:N-acylneuraminate-9-phosphatase isoform X1 [Scleropages formosus]
MGDGGVKAILFDLDNTLIDTAGASRAAILEVTELLKTRFDDEHVVGDICERFNMKLLQESFQPSRDLTIDQVRIGHWDQAIREAGGKGPDSAVAARCYWTWKNTRLTLLSIPEPFRNLLLDLRGTLKLLLLTNGEVQTQREKIQAVGCEGLFDAIVVGGDHAEEKPALSIFHHCFQVLGVGPKDCVMVGDSLGTDILGGINAGVRATVWVNGTGTASPDVSIKPDYTVPSVLDLPSVLACLNHSVDRSAMRSI